ncbi:unnamed protein product [Closterium sp. NIES-54]
MGHCCAADLFLAAATRIASFCISMCSPPALPSPLDSFSPLPSSPSYRTSLSPTPPPLIPGAHLSARTHATIPDAAIAATVCCILSASDTSPVAPSLRTAASKDVATLVALVLFVRGGKGVRGEAHSGEETRAIRAQETENAADSMRPRSYEGEARKACSAETDEWREERKRIIVDYGPHLPVKHRCPPRFPTALLRASPCFSPLAPVALPSPTAIAHCSRTLLSQTAVANCAMTAALSPSLALARSSHLRAAVFLRPNIRAWRPLIQSSPLAPLSTARDSWSWKQPRRAIATAGDASGGQTAVSAGRNGATNTAAGPDVTETGKSAGRERTVRLTSRGIVWTDDEVERVLTDARKRIGPRHVDMMTWRRAIHAYPELAFEEERTAEMVAGLLAEWGYDVDRSLGSTGVVGTLTVGDGGSAEGGEAEELPPAIMLRADMDALPMEEGNAFEHRSQRRSTMHACGHDGETHVHACMIVAAPCHAHACPHSVARCTLPQSALLAACIAPSPPTIHSVVPCSLPNRPHGHAAGGSTVPGSMLLGAAPPLPGAHPRGGGLAHGQRH